MRSLKISIILVMELAAFFVALLLLGAFLLAGRLMLGPLTVTELTPVFESLLSQPSYGIKANIGQSALTWDKDRKKAVLDLTNIYFVDRLQQNIANVPEILLVLNPLGYFDETRSPWNVIVRGAHGHIRMDKEGKIHLGALTSGDEGNLQKPAKEAEEELTFDSVKTLLRDIFHSPSTRVGGLGLFANLVIENSGLTFIDEGKQVTWNATMPKLSLHRVRNDYEGKVAIKLAKQDMETDFNFSLFYKAQTKTFTATGSFDHLNPAVLADNVAQLKSFKTLSSPLTGSITIAYDDEINVVDAGLNLNLDKGEVILPSLFPKSLPFKSGQIVVRYDVKAEKLRLEPMRFDFNHFVLQGVADIEVGRAPRSVSADFTLSNLPVEHIKEYWPESAGKNARDWILENIHKGKVDEVKLHLGLNVPGDDVSEAAMADLHGSVKISNVEMTCWKPLPNVSKVSAEANFTDKGFDVTIASGEQGDIKLKPSHVTITGLDAENQILTLDANLAGPVPVLLGILDREPLGYAKKISISPKDVDGSFDGKLHMAFPLLKDLLFDQIELKADVKLAGASIRNVAGLGDASDGDIALTVDKNALSFAGKAKMNDVPSDIEWKETFNAPADAPLSHAVIKADIKADEIGKFGVDLPVIGTQAFPATLTYDRYAQLSRLDIKADAKDAALTFTTLSYPKPAGDVLDISAALEWGDGKPMRLTQLKLTGKDIDVSGSGNFDASASLAKLNIKPLRLGANNLAIDYAKDKAGVPVVAISGEALDIRHAFDAPENKDKQEKADAPPKPLQISADIKRVITGEKSELANLQLKAARDSAGISNLSLSLLARNKTPFNFSVQPSGGRNVLAMTTPDLGNVLAALDVTDTLIGGKLSVDGKSEANDALRNILGHIKLENYRVKNMPALAQLISAISPDGLAAILGGEGLGFGELAAEYVWERDNIVITKAHTSSGSLGLTTAGKIDLKRSAIELEGQVIPVYFISRILSSIPVLGDLLTGGEGQGLFAATYRVEGPIAKAKVSVNPVSVLAPGILRNILFMDKNITNTDKAAEKPKK